ncbi:MAG TPA: tetratricopeptide repeat protein [Nitrospiria bacterium]|nr:tetratricopeptide repeat protein [Nitrospiria bacterium]
MSVLKEGLQIHPTYLTARVSLGKVYLQKGLISEAKGEFEGVIKLNPDNLLAHRKLAKIYKDEGNLEASKASCNVVLSQSPADKEMKALLAEIEKMLLEAPPVVEAPASTPPARPGTRDVDFSGPEEDDYFSKVPPKPSELAASLQRSPSPPTAVPETISPEPSLVDIKPESAPSARPNPPPPTALVEKRPEEAHLVEKDLGAPPPAVEHAAPDLLTEHVRTAPAPMDAVPPLSDYTGSPPFNEAEAGEQAVVPGPSENLASVTLADLYVDQGHIDKGIEIYRRILEKYPQDEKIREKLAAAERQLVDRSSRTSGPLQELHGQTAGLKSVDSKREEKIRRLQAWLDNIKKGGRQ